MLYIHRTASSWDCKWLVKSKYTERLTSFFFYRKAWLNKSKVFSRQSAGKLCEHIVRLDLLSWIDMGNRFYG